MNWTFSLNGALPTDHLRFKTSTHAERNATYVHPDVTSLTVMCPSAREPDR